ncbi:MAG: hypothetical protein LZF86_80131 [Nitrospira sp.]|nr:MAG: hypothetical protein LZF86_80131 [Nitrospira sp.]
MPDMVHVQCMNQNTYLGQLIKQCARIDQSIEQGGTVTINLSDGDRSIVLKVSRDQVVEQAAPLPRSLTGKTPTLADNESLVAMATNSFSFDIGEANRNISTSEIHAQFTKAAASTQAGDAKAALRPAMELLEPAVTYRSPDWIVLADCQYAALDGFTVTVKQGFKTDLASIPRLLWGVIASFELSLAAPIVHDLIYRAGGIVALPDGEVLPVGTRFERKEADDLFLELMTRSKIGYWKRNVAYLAVRAFGGSSWQQDRAQES